MKKGIATRVTILIFDKSLFVLINMLLVVYDVANYEPLGAIERQLTFVKSRK